MIITFCGHSTYADKAEDEAKILAFLEEKVGDGEVELYLGEYGSFDSFARRCCEKYKKNAPERKADMGNSLHHHRLSEKLS